MFLYVIDTKSRDKLISLGYKLLKEDNKRSIWIFVNKENLTFNSADVSCVVSDTLTF